MGRSLDDLIAEPGARGADPRLCRGQGSGARRRRHRLLDLPAPARRCLRWPPRWGGRRRWPRRCGRRSRTPGSPPPPTCPRSAAPARASSRSVERAPDRRLLTCKCAPHAMPAYGSHSSASLLAGLPPGGGLYQPCPPPDLTDVIAGLPDDVPFVDLAAAMTRGAVGRRAGRRRRSGPRWRRGRGSRWKHERHSRRSRKRGCGERRRRRTIAPCGRRRQHGGRCKQASRCKRGIRGRCARRGARDSRGGVSVRPRAELAQRRDCAAGAVSRPHLRVQGFRRRLPGRDSGAATRRRRGRRGRTRRRPGGGAGSPPPATPAAQWRVRSGAAPASRWCCCTRPAASAACRSSSSPRSATTSTPSRSPARSTTASAW